MRRLTPILAALGLLAAALVSCAPQVGKARGPGAAGREIPIELHGGVVMVPVKVGPSRVLRIVLDTGMGFDGVLLYAALPESTFPGPLIEVRIPGAGAGEPARGLMAESASFSAGPVRFTGQPVVWLTDSLMTGFHGDGVMGYSLFGHWIVEIDYDRKMMVLHEPGAFKPDSSWTVVPMVLRKNSTPWVKLRVSISGEVPQELDCYLDLAANDEVVFLVRDDAKFKVPDGLEPLWLGRGLSGDVYGSKGRAALIELDTFLFRDVPVAFASDEVRGKQPGADAVICGKLLGRFNTVYDYAGGRLYLRPRQTPPRPPGSRSSRVSGRCPRSACAFEPPGSALTAHERGRCLCLRACVSRGRRRCRG
jgi:hypothetical protein